jgi:hypothetical protein
MAIKINGTNTTASPGITGPDTDTGLVYGTDEVQVVTGGTTRATVDSAGNVGINNSSPSSYNSDGRNLVVGSGSGGQGLTIASGTSGYGNIYFADGTSGDALYSGMLSYYHADNHMQFRTASTERMRIDSSGNVGIGTSSPNSYTNYNTLTLNGTSGGAIDFETSGTKVGTVYSSASLLYIQASASKSLALSSNDTERMRIDSSGNVIFKRGADVGNILQITGADTTSETLEIGIASGGGNAQLTATNAAGGSNTCGLVFRTRSPNSTAERMRIQSGGGISFNGDTAQANALDDYEEGTWTPVDQQGDAYAQGNACSYTKIGNLVFISFDINGTATANGSYVYGLPFNVKINSNGGGNYCFYPGYVSGTLNQDLYAHSGQTHIRLYHGTSAISINSNDRLIMSGTYLAA